MSTKGSYLKGFIARGGAWYFLASIYPKVIYALTPIWLVRAMGVDEFGLLEFVRAIFFILVPFFCAGLHESLLLEGAKKSKEEVRSLYSKLLPISIGFSMILACGVLLSNSFGWVLDGGEGYLLIMAAYPVTFGVFLLYTNYLRAANEKERYAACMILSASLFALFVLFSNGNGELVALAWVLCPLVAVLLVAAYSAREHAALLGQSGEIESIKFGGLLKSLKYGFLVGLGGVVSQLSLFSDSILIGVITGESELVGIYRVLAVIPSLVLFLPNLMLKGDFVFIANLSGSDVKRYYFDYVRSFVVLVVFPLLVFAASSRYFFEYVYGLTVEGDILLVNLIMILSCVFSCLLRVPLGGIMYALGYARFNVINAVFSAVLGLVLGWVLINYLGIIGAAVSTLVVVLLGSAAQLYYFLLKVAERR